MVKKILFVCTVNRLRSKTAEDLLKDDSRFEVKSAGIDKTATTQLTRELLEWADCIFVMEKSHRNIIHRKYPDIYKNKKIICLYIDDVYDYMDPGLVELIKERISKFI